MAGQADLRMGIAGSRQKVGGELQPLPCGRRLDRSSRNHFRLIEAALPSLTAIKRHRDDKRLVTEIQLSDDLTEHPAQNVCGGLYPVKLQQVHQFPQTAFVAAVSDRVLKRTIHAAAYRTSPLSVLIAFCIGGKNSLAAD